MTRLPVFRIFKTAVGGFEVVILLTLERWRIESTARDGGVVGQPFSYDRDAGLVVRALDDAGADLVFSDHVRGPVDPARFEVP